MRVYIGYDHNGVKMAYKLAQDLTERGYQVNLPIEESDSADDYPVKVKEVVKCVLKDKGSRAILICGTGLGMVMAANRFKKIRAILGVSEEAAYFGRRHEDVNVLVLADGYKDDEMQLKGQDKKALSISERFLSTQFMGETRHKRRIKLLDNLTED